MIAIADANTEQCFFESGPLRAQGRRVLPVARREFNVVLQDELRSDSLVGAKVRLDKSRSVLLMLTTTRRKPATFFRLKVTVPSPSISPAR
jgi:hypothetical protein